MDFSGAFTTVAVICMGLGAGLLLAIYGLVRLAIYLYQHLAWVAA